MTVKHEHTPGPWRRSSTNGRDYHIIAGKPGLARIFATVQKAENCPRMQCSSTCQDSRRETEANARLIAKAPLLLKILEGFLATLDTDDLEEEAVVRSHYNTHIGLWNAAIDAHKAITGKEES